MKILQVHGPSDTPSGNPLEDQFPKAEAHQVDIFGLWGLEEQFDLIYCAFSLSAVAAHEVPKTIEQMTCLLADRGELWLVTPSLEWAAAQVLSESPHPALHSVLFGDRDHPARSGYTLAWLRALIEERGLIPRKAQQGVYQVQLGEKPVQVPCNIVIGWKILQ